MALPDGPRPWIWIEEDGTLVVDLDLAPEGRGGLDDEGNLWVDEDVYRAFFGGEVRELLG